MYLHKISIDKEILSRDRKIYQNAYLLHKKMWTLVSRAENQQRDFLYRVEYEDYQIKYIYLLAPHQISSHNGIKVTVSPRYQPQIKTGERLYFNLRANPVIKRKENGKSKEYGLVMDAKYKFKINGQIYQEQLSLDELIHKVCMKWLVRKGEQHGFSVKQFEVTIDNAREYLIKSPTKQEYMLRTHDFSGVLTVVDPKTFINALFTGIGPAKAFGCGLMLVKRV